jgi:hypothetical protein
MPYFCSRDKTNPICRIIVEVEVKNMDSCCMGLLVIGLAFLSGSAFARDRHASCTQQGTVAGGTSYFVEVDVSTARPAPQDHDFGAGKLILKSNGTVVETTGVSSDFVFMGSMTGYSIFEVNAEAKSLFSKMSLTVFGSDSGVGRVDLSDGSFFDVHCQVVSRSARQNQ